MAPSVLHAFLKQAQDAVDQALDKFLPKETERPRVLHEAMRYSIFSGGKRLRPALVLAAAELCGRRGKDVLPAASAMELIHTYSLVHDDLPAMDDDDLRRGRATNHKVYGEDMAILVGDALLTHAFGLLATNIEKTRLSAKDTSALLWTVVRGCGGYGMIGGQVADIKSDQGRWKRFRKGAGFDGLRPRALLNFVHYHKTAALIVASLEVGARLAQAEPKAIAALRGYGEAIGLAFQVKDDLLDILGDKKKLGKKGSDVANQKLTFPVLYGINGSNRRLTKLVQEAHSHLRPFGKKAGILHELADFIADRDH